MNRGHYILYVFLAAVILLLPGCKRDTKKISEGQKQIPREQMIRLMADIEITESALKIKQIKMTRDSINKIANQSFDSLYTFYGVTPEQFRENLKYYQADMEDFQSMADEVIVVITKHKDSVLTFFKDPPPDTLKIKPLPPLPKKPALSPAKVKK